MIIGLIFLKYISTAFDKKYQQLVAEGDGFGDDESIIKCVRGVYGIFIEKDGNRTCEYVWGNCDWTDEDKINKKIQEIAEDVKKDES